MATNYSTTAPRERAIKVHLTWVEVALATQVGTRRNMEAIRRGLPDRHGRDDSSGWNDHIEGACGELACAKALGVYWDPSVNTFQVGGDVFGYEVRTRRRANYELIVRRNDASERVFILVRGKAPNFDVVGWISGAAAKQAEWLRDYGAREPAYFVPDERLMSPQLLVRARVPGEDG